MRRSFTDGEMRSNLIIEFCLNIKPWPVGKDWKVRKFGRNPLVDTLPTLISWKDIRDLNKKPVEDASWKWILRIPEPKLLIKSRSTLSMGEKFGDERTKRHPLNQDSSKFFLEVTSPWTLPEEYSLRFGVPIIDKKEEIFDIFYGAKTKEFKAPERRPDWKVVNFGMSSYSPCVRVPKRSESEPQTLRIQRAPSSELSRCSLASEVPSIFEVRVLQSNASSCLHFVLARFS